MTRIKQEIFDLVKRRRRTTSELLSLVWYIHPQDAPSRKCIHNHISQINKTLKGKAIRAPRGQRCETAYRLVSL